MKVFFEGTNHDLEERCLITLIVQSMFYNRNSYMAEKMRIPITVT